MRPDVVIMVDWSAAATPKTGADSVWFALHRRGAAEPAVLENPATRVEALERLTDIAVAEVAAGRRLLIGFDFPFGYPFGAAERMLATAPESDVRAPLWARLWALLAARIEDGPRNANNRFDVAERLNAEAFDGAGPFWGRPPTHRRAALPERKPSGYGLRYPDERRLVERRVRSTHPVWKLFTTGSVGGQALVGIAALERFRRDPRLAGRCAVWPFETGLGPSDAPIVIAEIYPSLRPPDPRYAIKDAGQVVSVAARLARLSEQDRLTPLMGGSADLSAAERPVVEREEAWIVGIGAEDLLRADD